MASYEKMADDLRIRLDQGEWMPGGRLPSMRTLAGDYQVEVNTARKAVTLLATRGYVRIRGGVGAIVLDRAVRPTPLSIGRSIGYHPQWGYIYNPSAGDWLPIGTPDRSWVALDHEVADLLEVLPGTRALARHRVVGPPSGPAQTTTTFFGSTLGPRFDGDSTGPGGWMQQAEQDMGLGPLTWWCKVRSRLATERESADLDLPRVAPVLVLAFVITSRKGSAPLAVDVMTFDATRFEVEYPVRRSRAARWPVPLATGENRPLPGCD